MGTPRKVALFTPVENYSEFSDFAAKKESLISQPMAGSRWSEHRVQEDLRN